MLDPKEKLAFLTQAKFKTESKVYDLELEIKTFTRKQMLAKDSQLIAIDAMIKNLKSQKEIFIDKLDIIEEEILDNEKLVGKQPSVAVGPDKEEEAG